MSRLIEKLTEYGADIPGILERFLEDEELYASCIETFYADTGFNDLGIAIINKQYEDAFNYAHTLKGVAGNMGLTPLYNSIVILVESLRYKDYLKIEEQYDSIMKEYFKSKNLFCSN